MLGPRVHGPPWENGTGSSYRLKPHSPARKIAALLLESPARMTNNASRRVFPRGLRYITRILPAGKRAKTCRRLVSFSPVLPPEKWEVIPGSYDLHYYFNPKTYVMQWSQPAGAVVCKVTSCRVKARTAF